MRANPFGVQNPEHVDPEYIARNFVEVLTDFPRLKEHSNTFIHGARGTGKSMLLRSLEPRVMILQHKASKLNELPFLAVHVPLRTADFGAPEFSRFKGYTLNAIGEHLLVMHIVLRVAQLLSSFSAEISDASARVFQGRFENLFSIAGGSISQAATPTGKNGAFELVASVCERNIFEVRQYLVRQPFRSSEPDYQGALAGFLDFLVPLAREVKRMEGLPNVPLFVMLDDADNLPIPLQRGLNSWVSTRSTGDICLKVTTQLAYATMRTLDNRIIESPHDYAEVNLTAVYTSALDTYSGRLREIITKRLQNAGIKATVDEFFPLDAAQEKRLIQIEAEIVTEHLRKNEESDIQVGATRVRDEKRRYAVPTLMREISGASKSSHTFSYAGFRSLVDLSSGVVRWFLEPASRMYDQVISERSEEAGLVSSIPVRIQDRVIKEWSAEFLEPLNRQSSEISDDQTDMSEGIESLHADGHETILYEKLRNLIEGLGRLFRGRLLDPNAREQRVFSMVLRDRANPDLERVLNLGVRLGYLQRSDYAAKEALGGRRPRFILARRLGPHYKLDISGYAAHLSVMSQDLELAMRSPGDFVKTRLRTEASPTAQFNLDLDGGRLGNSDN
ncbi:hypothetical protein DSM25558_5453 [Agrobacterium sp. DSM 25558]|uniref:ORC-CDC6 family AAA ATPase n=1 Tax=Agrobacterium sp. DSM 25558 TaxID=1907665 RepID=UPI0009725452|nr:hypothetical protein [Agrobacterium sp. DSM 25558]SCX32364.1 hypothetical protein DSM25558_5453 [Agrobacterium sp. DSM 25558]